LLRKFTPLDEDKINGAGGVNHLMTINDFLWSVVGNTILNKNAYFALNNASDSGSNSATFYSRNHHQFSLLLAE
jgi:hypothetical protein